MIKNSGRFLSISIILLTSVHLYTAPVSAQTPHPELLSEKNRVVASDNLFEEEEEVEIDDYDAEADEVADWIYRVGDEWGKKVLVRRDLKNKKLKFVEVLRRTAKATAKVAKGTGFYLGQFNGFHLIATNYHVHIRLVNEPEDYKEIEFPFLDQSFNFGRTFGAWLEIDLALFAINVESKWDRKELQSVAKNFSFDYPITRNQELLTVGFGRAKNHYSGMVGTWDSDSKVFSGDNEFKIKYGLDEKGEKVGTWAFAVGCDASDGDSGSPVVTRDTGDIIGLLWGVAPRIAQSSQSLDNMIKENSPAIWKNLNYAVPAAKIKEFLLEKIESGAITDEVERKTILAFLGVDSSS
ncbi:MAG: trypsin-like peptidase domain-containing protein [Candidatus Brocadiales bacterium]|nr:trypsin-like peptidase domain-containing protein [Candidatus Brocadiales bacterium]